MKLEQVVPWGRGLREYQAMFQLSAADLKKNILACADGPASFNAELTQLGGHITSLDPIYQYSRDEIEGRILEVAPIIIGEVERNQQQFIWDFYTDVTSLYQCRMDSMALFLDDYDLGKQQHRYQTASLPDLNFSDQSFELALCSHFLFLYSEHFDLQFHIAAIQSLCDAAAEVRIYPLVTLQNSISPHLEPVLQWLEEHHFTTALIPVDYTFQHGATHMLQITQHHR